MAVTSLFVIGAGMAVLRVAINPLLRVAGGEENFAFNSAFAQLIFGPASFVSPLVFSDLVRHLDPAHPDRTGLYGVLSSISTSALPWASIYWIFAVVSGCIRGDDRMAALAQGGAYGGGVGRHALHVPAAAAQSIRVAVFLAIIAYVGCEQGTASGCRRSSAIPCRSSQGRCGCGGLLLGAHDRRLSPRDGLAEAVRQSPRLDRVFARCAVHAVGGPIRAGRSIPVAFPCIGFFASIMWPTLVSLGLNSVPQHHGPFAGILCSGIMGGALVPFVIGWLGDLYGLRIGMLFLYLPCGSILSVGVWARPLIRNATRGGRRSKIVDA